MNGPAVKWRTAKVTMQVGLAAVVAAPVAAIVNDAAMYVLVDVGVVLLLWSLLRMGSQWRWPHLLAAGTMVVIAVNVWVHVVPLAVVLVALVVAAWGTARAYRRQMAEVLATLDEVRPSDGWAVPPGADLRAAHRVTVGQYADTRQAWRLQVVLQWHLLADQAGVAIGDVLRYDSTVDAWWHTTTGSWVDETLWPLHLPRRGTCTRVDVDRYLHGPES